MRAELIAVGTEILLGQIDNSHARFLSEDLATLGISVYFHSAVGDNIDRLATLLQTALSRSDIVILTGGLGPTDDDLTREAVARVAGVSCVYDESAFETHVAPFFRRAGRTAAENNRKQAMRVGDAVFLPNPRGTAPGQYLRTGDTHVFLLPGPPLEMRPMYRESVRPRLLELVGEGVIESRVLHLFGIGESDAETRLKDLLRVQTNPTVAPLASEGEMLFRITAKARSHAEAQALIAPVEREIMDRLGRFVYGFDDDTLATVAQRSLIESGHSVAFAESCTGGLLTSMLVQIPGSSACLRGSVVAYDNAVKVGVLGVDPQTLERDGAVSEAVAGQMAEGVCRQLGADYGVGVTGVAGPGGGTAEKPVGLVYVAVSDLRGTNIVRRVFTGNREQVRIRAAKTALHALLEKMGKVRQ